MAHLLCRKHILKSLWLHSVSVYWKIWRINKNGFQLELWLKRFFYVLYLCGLVQDHRHMLKYQRVPWRATVLWTKHQRVLTKTINTHSEMKWHLILYSHHREKQWAEKGEAASCVRVPRMVGAEDVAETQMLSSKMYIRLLITTCY